MIGQELTLSPAGCLCGMLGVFSCVLLALVHLLFDRDHTDDAHDKTST